MKAIKSLAIHKKLASFRTLFPHDDHAEVKNVAGIYNDVLKFSRSVFSVTDCCQNMDLLVFFPGLVYILNPRQE
jgi:hypothetical protein